MQLIKKFKGRRPLPFSVQVKTRYQSKAPLGSSSLRASLHAAGGRTQGGKRSVFSKGAQGRPCRVRTQTQLLGYPLQALSTILYIRKESRSAKYLGLAQSVAGYLFYTPLFTPAVAGDFFRACPSDPQWFNSASPLPEWPRALTFFAPYTPIVQVDARLARAFGSLALLLSNNIGQGLALLRLSSGKLKLLPTSLFAVWYKSLR
jgi:hypothetical protein